MEFGVFDHIDASGQAPYRYYEERLQLCELYDQRGFYAYHCAEHHLSPIGMVPSPSVFLGAISQRTQRLRFGPLVYALPLYHPLRLIEEICLLDQMSGGRLEIGFGRGSSAAENRYFGQRYDEAQRIYAQTLEDILRTLETGIVTLADLDQSYQHLPLPVEPLQKPYPPVWYGVHSVESAQRAAKRGMNMVSLDATADTRSFTDAYRALWREERGAAPVPKMGLGRFVVVHEDEAQAVALATRAYKRWHESFVLVSNRHGIKMGHARPSEFNGMAEARRAIAGTPEKVARFVRDEMTASGCDYFVGQFAFGDMSHEEARSSISLFADRVMPALSDLTLDL
jgi:alkanesulfonate monooxygenase SsuD/methylene tetrahydromethanopterin reductase-like flavin-dependent oxidoreductase (luciferase family)